MKVYFYITYYVEFRVENLIDKVLNDLVPLFILGKIPKYPLNLCPKSQRHTYTILSSYYPPELILYVIFYPILAYVALVQKKKSTIVGPTR